MGSSSGNGYKRWSLSFTRALILGGILFVLVISMALFMVSAGLRCVDRDGCLREHCLDMYNKGYIDQYKNLIQDAFKNSGGKCRIQV